ncbi:MAG: YgfZ/GcvT domain-containing protein [Rudaea sp.]
MTESVASGELERQYAFVTERAGHAALALSVLRVEGSDRTKWLHKLITADVEHLAAGQGVRSALLEAKGHFVADFVVLGLEDSFLLLAEPEAAGTLLQNLQRYIIREKVRLTEESGRWTGWTVVGRQANDFVLKEFGAQVPAAPFCWNRSEVDASSIYLIHGDRARLPSVDLLVPAVASGVVSERLRVLPEIGADLLEILRVEAGLPRWGTDFDAGVLALEIPQVMSIRVDQGCYVGQEVVARLVHRGHVNRHLVGLKFAGVLPSAGETIDGPDGAVGSVTSAVASPRLGPIGLGFVRREFAAPGTELRIGQGSAQVVGLPFE